MTLTAAVVARGVTSGIESANKVLMPSLFVILLVLVVHGAVSADMPAAFRFMFHFDLKELSAPVVLSGHGAMPFTLSLGMERSWPTALTYRAAARFRHLPADRNRRHARRRTCRAGDLPIVFANGQPAAAGPGLLPDAAHRFCLYARRPPDGRAVLPAGGVCRLDFLNIPA